MKPTKTAASRYLSVYNLFCAIAFSYKLGKHEAKAVVVVPVVGVVVVTVRHTAVPGIVVPTAATEHTVAPGCHDRYRLCLAHLQNALPESGTFGMLCECHKRLHVQGQGLLVP